MFGLLRHLYFKKTNFKVQPRSFDALSIGAILRIGIVFLVVDGVMGVLFRPLVWVDDVAHVDHIFKYRSQAEEESCM